MHQLEQIIRYTVYLLTLLFTWITVSPLIVPTIKKRRERSRFKGNYEIQIEAAKPKGRWYRELELFLITTIGIGSQFAVFTFIAVSVFCGCLTALFLQEAGYGLSQKIIVALLVMLLPAFILYIRRQNIRINSSYEGDVLITELIAQYKLNHLNMLEAIDKTVPRLLKQKNTRRSLTRLSMKIKESGNVDDIERYTQEFTYTFGTNWSQLLANNIYMAIVYRDGVKEALEDILDELTQTKKINEKGNQDNGESFLIIKYVAPGGYIISILSLFRYFDFSWKKFLIYQFKNPMGLNSFLFFGFFLILNSIIYLFMRKPKNDF